MNKKSDINREKKREIIILSAKKLIIEKGYQRTNVEDITSRINIAKGSFYTYFKSKDQLIITILNEAAKSIAKRNRETRKGGLSFEELLTYSVKKKFEVDEEIAFRTLFFYHLALNLESLSGEITKKLIEIKNLNLEHWYEILQKFSSELNFRDEKDIKRYAEYIDELVNLTLKNTLYYSQNENGNIFISNIDFVLQKVSEKSINKEMEFLIKTLKKIFK
ncbi:MAG: TetR/AcrR family transcriptional regulator [Fusobacteriaceae bacterium]